MVLISVDPRIREWLASGELTDLYMAIVANPALADLHVDGKPGVPFVELTLEVREALERAGILEVPSGKAMG